MYNYINSNWKLTCNVKVLFYFHAKVSEHILIQTSNLKEKLIKTTKELSISYHLLQCNWLIAFDDFDILPFDFKKYKILIKENKENLVVKHNKSVHDEIISAWFFDRELSVYLLWQYY